MQLLHSAAVNAEHRRSTERPFDQICMQLRKVSNLFLRGGLLCKRGAGKAGQGQLQEGCCLHEKLGLGEVLGRARACESGLGWLWRPSGLHKVKWGAAGLPLSVHCQGLLVPATSLPSPRPVCWLCGCSSRASWLFGCPRVQEIALQHV
jgi:hypothetical protein